MTEDTIMVDVYPGTECWSCGMPQPDWPGSLHLEDCPEHDDETCVACEEVESDEVV